MAGTAGSEGEKGGGAHYWLGFAAKKERKRVREEEGEEEGAGGCR